MLRPLNLLGLKPVLANNLPFVVAPASVSGSAVDMIPLSGPYICPPDLALASSVSLPRFRDSSYLFSIGNFVQSELVLYGGVPCDLLQNVVQEDLANGSFGSGTDRVKFGSGQIRVKSIRVGYGFGSGEVRVRF